MTHFALIPTSVLMIVVSATTTGSTMVTMLCGPSETEILATTYSTALAPAHLLLDVPVVGCGDLKSLCQLENPIGLHDDVGIVFCSKRKLNKNKQTNKDSS